MRSLLYGVVSLLFIGAFMLFISNSSKLDLIFIRGNEAFTQNHTSEITNRFTVKISHQGSKAYSLVFRINNPDLAKKIKIVAPQSPLELNTHEKKTILFFKFDKSLLENGARKILVDVVDHKDNINVSQKEVALVGPAN